MWLFFLNLSLDRSIKHPFEYRNRKKRALGCRIGNKFEKLIEKNTLDRRILFFYRLSLNKILIFKYIKKLDNKFIILFSTTILFTIFFYKYALTGNLFYPILNNVFIPDNEFYVGFEQGLKEYKRGFMFPLWMIIPKNYSNISHIIGPATGFLIISVYLYSLIKNRDLLLPLSQIILLLLFCQGRASYYTFPIIYLGTVQIQNEMIWLKINNLKNLFIALCAIQITLFGFISIYSNFITLSSVINFENSMNKYAHNYNSSKLINSKVIGNYVNLVHRQNYLFGNYPNASQIKFEGCLEKYSNFNNSKYKLCAEENNIKAIIVKSGEITEEKSFSCEHFNVDSVTRNFFLNKRRNIDICKLNN